MEVITQQQTSILYIGANQRFAEEFHRLAENVSGSVAENVVSALKWLHNNTDFETNKWVNVHKVADAILCENLNSEEDLKLLKSYIEKTFDPSKKIPFVLLGTQVSREDKLMALENGFDDFFNHPISFDTILERIGFLKELKSNLRKQEIATSITRTQKYKIGFWKRSFDILLSGGVLLLASPFLLLVILAIRL